MSFTECRPDGIKLVGVISTQFIPLSVVLNILPNSPLLAVELEQQYIAPVSSSVKLFIV